GVPLADLNEVGRLDLTIDGADEVDPQLDLIKGGGGALLREKIVASVSGRYVVVVDDGKLSPRLGSRFALPVEVVRFGWRVHVAALERLGAASVDLRVDRGGAHVVTDEGHLILDCRFAGGIDDPPRLERELRGLPGVVETGLFLGLASWVVVAGEGGVRVIERPG
nr:ribose 5-phosphate isomerase A [Gemmatimonadota bacterium]